MTDMMSDLHANAVRHTPDEALQLLFPRQELLLQLRRLRVASSVRTRGMLAGRRRSATLGSSMEFADYRAYVPGDDIRRLDWNVYGRTDKAYIRQYWDEQELSLQLVLDASRSMTHFGDGDSNKWHYALRLAASVGYTALGADDRVAVKMLQPGQSGASLPFLHGRAGAAKLMSFLSDFWRSDWERVRSEGLVGGKRTGLQGELAESEGQQEVGKEPHEQVELDMLSMFRAQCGFMRPGATWLFTDAWFESGIKETLLMLAGKRQHTVLVHLLSPKEQHPRLDGELLLIDSELRSGKEAAVSRRLLHDYEAALASYKQELAALCSELGTVYLFADTGKPVENAIAEWSRIPGALSRQ
ncbi:DUF58 domain-containing protein [Paenibacillus sp. J5C_2022]|uniref:DUF58 domain-containing protein n=1 Tax=Paenibacillus sp. J5C2022 TaxID=2977129 RepID=UPI0021D2F8E1|nr:DUF58 domain-containing protein [Paenibacillus sp. J5C2022]MCU6707204.1 DUF58 domain-containing protein [Paenibacillus sp. J5C2022]